MADKSLVQLNPKTDLKDADIFHMVRDNIDYKITGSDLKKAIVPYYEYSALISQIAPLTLTTGGFAGINGAKFTITTFVTGDDFSNMELVSGTMNTSGAVIKATSDSPTDWTNGSTLNYGGEPFVVSQDVNNEYNPTVNTFIPTITFTYVTTGTYKINVAYNSRKIEAWIGTSDSTAQSRFVLSNTTGDDGFDLLTFTLAGSAADDRMIFIPIKLFGYF
jgi:hypothetical protein